MLPALNIATPRDKLTDIQQTMRRFISPILVNSVLGKALADRGQLSPSRLTHADLEALVESAMVGLRLFIDPAVLPELMVQLTDILMESGDDDHNTQHARTTSVARQSRPQCGPR
jgi:hypothetical protein